MQTGAPVLYIVVPCYNEQESLPETAKRLRGLLTDMAGKGTVSQKSRILMVDDGSRDGTWAVMERLCEEDEFEAVKLSRNRGHQNALLAGLMTARESCDASVSIDADLQDDINAIPRMVDKYREGAQVVYGVRSAREADTAFKRGSAHAFYRLLSMMGVEAVYDHADYRLLGRAALDALWQYGEVNLFLRGMVPLLGFKTEKVYYERGERFAGESKYPMKKMLSFAWQGITSLSTTPIRWITSSGAVLLAAGLITLLAFLIAGISFAPAILSCVLIIGGLQLIAIGVVGEYVGKAYLETKRRPRYIIEKYLR